MDMKFNKNDQDLLEIIASDNISLSRLFIDRLS